MSPMITLALGKALISSYHASLSSHKAVFFFPSGFKCGLDEKWEEEGSGMTRGEKKDEGKETR